MCAIILLATRDDHSNGNQQQLWQCLQPQTSHLATCFCSRLRTNQIAKQDSTNGSIHIPLVLETKQDSLHCKISAKYANIVKQKNSSPGSTISIRWSLHGWSGGSHRGVSVRFAAMKRPERNTSGYSNFLVCQDMMMNDCKLIMTYNIYIYNYSILYTQTFIIYHLMKCEITMLRHTLLWV